MDQQKLLGIPSEHDLKYPTPLSLEWRLFHNTCYLIGGICFFFGSMCYFPSLASYVLGGWLFTVGSAGFFLADGLEWWTNNRVGCFHDKHYQHSYEKAMGPFFAEANTTLGKWQRMENGINFFASLTGSTLYLIGSIMFIPVLNDIVQGTYVFIYGSAIIFMAQSWKLLRAGKLNEDSPSSKQFQCSNLSHDLSGVLVDLFAGIGGGSYLIGSVLFLPDYDINDDVTFAAATWFQIGGTCYLFSGLCMFYRYFYTTNYPH